MSGLIHWQPAPKCCGDPYVFPQEEAPRAKCEGCGEEFWASELYDGLCDDCEEREITMRRNRPEPTK